MRVRFWGTRGSIAKPGPSTLRFGGNTSCLEVVADDGTLVVIDCGTGAHELTRQWALAGELPPCGHLLVSHTHWDHIQGFPFFDAVLEGESEWDVYAPGGRRDQLRRSIAGQMSYDYHPVALERKASCARFHDLREGELEIGGIHVTARYLNHPALTLGYRLEADGAVFVYAADHEPHVLCDAATPGAPPIHVEDQRHVEFLADADLVVHDAQYAIEDFPAKAGWGHTPVEQAVDYALAARAERLALFHHDPSRDDDAVAALVQRAAERAEAAGGGLDVFGAAEGAVFEVSGERPAPRLDPARSARVGPGLGDHAKLLLVEADPAARSELSKALEAEGLQVTLAQGASDALELARSESPDLVVIDLDRSESERLDLCRRLAHGSKRAPVLVTTGHDATPEAMARAFDAGAADVLARPLRSALLRARARSWLMRAAS